MGKIAVSFIPDTNPIVLEWARKVIGLRREDAAARLGVSSHTLRLWEEGFETEKFKSPSLGQLRKMAEVYHKPLATLLMPRLPHSEEPITDDFRLLKDNTNRSWSLDLRLAMWRVQMQRDTSIRIAQETGMPDQGSGIALHLDDEIEVAGAVIRSWLEEDAPNPVNRYGKRDFAQWRELIEARAILVTQISFVDLEEMRGYSISDQPFPIIALNGSDSPNGKVFSLMHELAHILLNVGGLCDMEDKQSTGKGRKERVERFCNAVAAAILMPHTFLQLDTQIARASRPVLWSDLDIQRLASRFGVSHEALILRLISVGVATWKQYAELRPRYQEHATERRRQSTGFYMPPIQRKARDYGRRYSFAMLEAYSRDLISGRDLANYMNMRLDHLPQLEKYLGIRR